AHALGGEVAGGQVRAPGPNHSPIDRSLSVKINDAGDDIVTHSFADGADQIAVKDWARQKIGMEPFRPNGRKNGNGTHFSDTDTINTLAPKPSAPSAPLRVVPAPAVPRKLVCRYDYKDVDGNLLYQVERYEPKDFRQRRPDGKGGWITHG